LPAARSGTTLLHNLLSQDPAFCFPTIVDALRPYDFYPNPFEFISRRILLRCLPPTRPMDDIGSIPGCCRKKSSRSPRWAFDCRKAPTTETIADKLLRFAGTTSVS
jgi:hypothetical protein